MLHYCFCQVHIETHWLSSVHSWTVLQFTEWLAACTKKRIAICYTLVYRSPVCYDFWSHCQKWGVSYWVVLRWTCSESGAKVTFYQTHFVRFYLMGHCTGTLGMRYNSAAPMMLCKLPTSLLISCFGPNSPHLSPLITWFADMYNVSNVRRWSTNVNEFKQHPS